MEDAEDTGRKNLTQEQYDQFVFVQMARGGHESMYASHIAYDSDFAASDMD